MRLQTLFGRIPSFQPVAIAYIALVSFIALSSSASETEPHDQLGQASPLPPSGSTTETFGAAGDLDWFRITVSEPGRLIVSVVSPPPNVRAEIVMYGRNTELLPIYKNAVNNGDDVHVIFDVIIPGTYFARLRELEGDISAGSYLLTTTFQPVVDSHETNDRIGKASLMNGSPMTGTLFPKGDIDWYRIYADVGTRLALELRGSVEMQGELSLYDPDMNWMGVYSAAANRGDRVLLDYEIPSAGIYSIRVRDVQGQTQLDPYSLTFTGGNPGYLPTEPPVSNEVEINNSLAEANQITLGGTVTGSIGAVDDRDWYAFVPTETGQVIFSMDQTSPLLELELSLYGDSGDQLLSARAGLPGGLFSMVCDFTDSDRYYLRISNPGADVSSSSYAFSTTVVPVVDSFEPNDGYGDAKLLNQVNQIQGYLFKTGDQDWFRLEMAAPGELTAILKQIPENITASLTLFDLSHRELGLRTGNAGVDLELTVTVATAGTYLLRVADGGNDDESTQPYTLTVFGAEFRTFAPVALIDRINPGAIVVGDAVSLSGRGTDSDGAVVEVAWRSDIDGPISNQASFTTTGLSVGTHTIYFSVRDNDGIWSSETSESLYVGKTVSDELEPNDSFVPANEIALNRPLKGKIQAAGDLDFFKIYVPEAGHVVADLRNVPSELRMELTFYDRYWDYLGASGSAATLGDDVSVVLHPDREGFVYLRARSLYGEANPDLSYTLAVSFIPAPDPYELNNELLNAVVTPAESVSGRFFPANENDWYKVWVVAGSTLVSEITSSPADARAEISIYGRNREWTGRYGAAQNPGDPVSAQLEVDTSGFYYLRVRELSGVANWTDAYELRVTGAVPGYTPEPLPVQTEVESNDMIADGNRVTLVGTVQGTIGTATDEDWYAWVMPTPGIIHTHLAVVPPVIKARLGIYRDDAEEMGMRRATNPGDPVPLDTHVTVPGTYHLRVQSLEGYSEEPYVLEFSATPVNDGFEPNDQMQDAAILNTRNRVQGFLFDTGDIDWFRVTSDTGEHLTVTIGDVPNYIRPEIHLYNRHGERLALKRASNDGQSFTLSYDVPETGDYLIRVSDTGNDSFSVDPYTLVIVGARFDSYVPLAVIRSISPSPADTGQTIIFEGTGQDTDGSLIGYRWRSSIDGEFSQSRVAQTDVLTPGAHIIYFQVKDNDQNWSPEISSLLLLGVPAPMEMEPNDLAGAATSMAFDQQYQGNMDAAGDLDWYRISIAQPGRLTLQCANPIGTFMRAELNVYNPDVEYTDYSSASNDGDPVTLVMDVIEPGDYYLRLRDLSSRPDGDYTVSAHFEIVPDPFESNHDFAHAAPISPNDRVEAFIMPVADVDYYEVTVPTPGSLDLALTLVPDDLRMELVVYGRDLSYLGIYANASNAGDEVFLTYDIPAAGSYFVRVRDLGNKVNPSEPYTFTTLFKPVFDVFEPNQVLGSASLLNASPVEAYLFPGGDLDFYQLFAAPGSEMTFFVDQVPDNIRLELTLYNANTGWMGVSSVADLEGESLTLEYGPGSGVYFLRVRDRDGDRAAEQPYRLSVTGAQLDHKLSIDRNTQEMEPNNDFSQSTQIGILPVTGTLGGDMDWYRFQVTEPAELRITLSVSGNHRSEIRLYDNNSIELVNRIAENPGDTSRLVYPISGSGTYYLRIIDADGTVSTDSYEVSLELVPVVDPTEPNDGYEWAVPLTFGVPVEPFLFPQRDHDWFVVDVTEPGTLAFEVSEVASNIEIELKLYDANFTERLHRRVTNPGEPLNAQDQIRQPGLYRVRIFDRGDDAYGLSPYTLTAIFIPAVDSGEPNNQFRDATPLVAENRAIGLIHPVGDWDWYRFSVVQPGPVRVQITQTSGIEADVRIWNDSRLELARKIATNEGDPLILVYDVAVPDTFYVSVSDDRNDTLSAEPYVLSIEGGQFTTAYPRVELPFTFAPNPVLLGQPALLSARVFDNDGFITRYEWTSDLDGLLGTDSTISVDSLRAGIHRIGLRVMDDEGHWSGRVVQNLIVAPETLTEAEYNNDVATALPIPLNTWVIGEITPASDLDFYRVQVNQCGRMTLQVDAVPPGLKAGVTVYDSNGDFAGQDKTVTNDGGSLSLSFNVIPGAYVFRIRDSANRSQSGTYAVRCEFTPGGDTREPNDSFANATLVEPGMILADPGICPAGDLDFYRFRATTPGRLSLILADVPESMRGEIVLYDRDLSLLSGYASAYNSGDPVSLNYDFCVPDDLYFRIRDLENRGTPDPYQLEVLYQPVVDPYEPNNSAGWAVLPEGNALDAYLFPANDMDWYGVRVTAGSVLKVALTGVPKTMRGDITLYDQNHEWLGLYETANNQGDEVFFSYTAPDDKIFLIRIRDADGRSHLAPYHLSVTGGNLGFDPSLHPTNVASEPNDRAMAAVDINMDADIAGQIDPANDDDWFRFWVNVPGILTVSHTDIPANVTSEIRVYDRDLVELGSRRTTNSGESNEFEVPTMTPGYHYLRLRDYGRDGASQDSYRLRVSHAPVIDPHEPNGSFGQATPLNESSVKGYLFAGTDHDWYRVFMSAPGKLVLSLDAVPDQNRPRLRIYGADGVERGSWVGTNPGIGGDDLLAYDSPAQGFYFIRVNDQESTYSAEPYTLRIAGADFSLAPFLREIGDWTINETIAWTLTVSAQDPDNPKDLIFQASNLPPGASFDPATRMLYWTPNRGQAGVYPGIHFEVTDGVFSDTQDITVTVAPVGHAPVLASVGDVIARPDVEMSFQISAFDPDSGDTLFYSADHLPSGAVFDADARTFTWTPTNRQLGVHSGVMFAVTDGRWTDFEYISVDVNDDIDPYEAWWLEHFTENQRNDPAISGDEADPDGDGSPNRDEFEADTLPLNADSILRVTDAIPTAQGLEIRWQGGINAIQYLERRISLNTGGEGWSVLYIVHPPTLAIENFLDETSGESTLFYRIRAQRP